MLVTENYAPIETRDLFRGNRLNFGKATLYSTNKKDQHVSTWRINPVSKCLGSPPYHKQFRRIWKGKLYQQRGDLLPGARSSSRTTPSSARLDPLTEAVTSYSPQQLRRWPSRNPSGDGSFFAPSMTSGVGKNTLSADRAQNNEHH